MTPFPSPEIIHTNGIDMAVHSAGPTDSAAPPIVFCHGWPELAFSWRFQLPALADAGYHAIAPDQRGYGGTTRPEPIESYRLEELCADLVGMLDARGIDKAIFCGHDWGGFVVWTIARLHPERVAGVIGVNTPHTARAPMDPIELMKAAFGENMYIVRFQQPGVVDAILAERPGDFLRMLYTDSGMTAEQFAELPDDQKNFDLVSALQTVPPGGPTEGTLIITADDLAHFVEVYERTGFTGGINWYRNFTRNWHDLADLPDTIAQPSLMICAADDVVLPPSAADGMDDLIPDLEKHTVPACGHWTQQQKPAETNALILDWLKRRFPV